MALIALRQPFDHAAERQYGVPAFNMNSPEQIHAVMQATAAVNSPAIVPSLRGCPWPCRGILPRPSGSDSRGAIAVIPIMKQIAQADLEAFGRAGNGSRIKPIGLANMAKRYESGELTPHRWPERECALLGLSEDTQECSTEPPSPAS